MQQKKYKSGFVAIIGRPNVGKSTFLNSVIGKKIAIMSDKPQTTRNRITGVYTTSDSQIVFLDTPGIHVPKHKLGEFMLGVVSKTLKEVDAIIFMVEAASGFGPGDKHILALLESVDTPIFLVINKIDKISPQEIEVEVEKWKSRFSFSAVVPISALGKTNIETIIQGILEKLPEGPQYYPDGMVTDQSENQIFTELIREKVLHFTREEIPHSIAVVIDYIEKEEELLNIYASIYTERDSQKGIIIGKGGTMLKKITTAARREMQNLLGNKIYLEIRVKVKKNWRKNESNVRNFGYDFRNY